jgi:hypothetical protein
MDIRIRLEDRRVTHLLCSDGAVWNIPTHPAAGLEPSPGVIQQTYAFEKVIMCE